MAFGRKDPTCPRCRELLDGAAPRPRFGGRAYVPELPTPAARHSAIWAHDCKASGCGPVCTFGDW